MPPSKRKSLGNDGPPEKKQATMHDYVLTKVTVPVNSGVNGINTSGEPREKVVTLSAEQGRIKRLIVEEEKNVYFTGPAGTGKSFLLELIVNALREKYAEVKGAVAITASTGAAASAIGGQTFHAWASLTPADKDFEKVYTKIMSRPAVKDRYLNTRVLVLDEVSMIPPELLDLVARLVERARTAATRSTSTRPLGGMQIVVTGDFFQLPPVIRGSKVPKFAFESDCWSRIFDYAVQLTHVFRQEDPGFSGLLNQLRIGKLSPEGVKTFQSLSRPLSGLLPVTELFTHREKVDAANKARLDRLRTPSHFFLAEDHVSSCKCQRVDDDEYDRRLKQLNQYNTPEELHFKTGAHVLMTRNVNERLLIMNGVPGRIRGFAKAQVDLMKNTVYEIQFEENGDVVYDPAGGPFTEKKYPWVDFSTSRGSVKVLVCPYTFKMEDSMGHCIARRTQVPLVLGWAMSIHRSQGQTLHRVRVDLAGTFETGQTYVALSRCPSEDGLQILNFSAHKVQAHPKVVKWNETLSTTKELRLLPTSPSSATISRDSPMDSVEATAVAKNKKPAMELPEGVVYYEDYHDWGRPTPLPKKDKPTSNT